MTSPEVEAEAATHSGCGWPTISGSAVCTPSESTDRLLAAADVDVVVACFSDCCR